ncbi:hypothetical protein MFLAVUS_011002 [Mucor flavus]|uniref:Uncharacterized protein n=1 Tax=Mucor flavus TaxID=439312 RepID=A0ABP9ZED2_9FUNG
MDLEIPNSIDPALQSFLRSLQQDMKTFAGLVIANKNLTAENESLRAQVQELQLLCENHKNVDNSRTRSPTLNLTPVLSTAQGTNASKYAPNLNMPPVPAANVTPKSSEWTQVVKRKTTPRKSKAPVSDHKILATARPFDGPPNTTDSPSGYEYVYLYRKRPVTRKDIRHRFGILGVTTARIIDINFPAHSVIGILLHKEYTPAFKAVLAKCKIPTIDDFNPTAGDNIADPKHAELDDNIRTEYSVSLHQDRCIRTLELIREYLVPSVTKFFVEKKWLCPEIVLRRVPRPLKKRTNLNQASLAEDFINKHYNNTQSEVTTPVLVENKFAHYGGGSNDNMDITEEFDTNAYGTDSDEDITDAEDLSSDKPSSQ